MGKIIVPNAVDRKEGFLYYVDGKGNVCEAQMVHHGKGKKKNKKTKSKKSKEQKLIDKEIDDAVTGDFDIDFG
jgi:hypothetical protein